jgi:hypothetical protein
MADQLQTDLNTVFSDDSFRKASPAEQTKLLSGLFDKHGYANAPAEEKTKLATALLQKRLGAPAAPTFGQVATEAGQNIAVQGAGIAPIVAGAELGGTLGAAGGPFDPLTVPLGAMAGAGLGAMTSPTARYYMGKLVGSEQPAPTMAASNYEGKIGVATEGFGPIAGNIAGRTSNAIIDSLVGRSELGQVGTDAAQATEQANLAAKQKLTDAATQEAAAQKTAATKAAEKTGQANLAARADASQAAVGKQADFARTHAAARAKADSDFQVQRSKLVKDIVPEAREETIGRTVEPAGPVSMEQGPERIARGEQFRDTITAPLQRWRSDWAAKRDKLLEPYANTAADDSPLKAAMAEEQAKWGPQARPYSPAAQRLLGKVEQLGTAEDPLARFFSPEELSNMSAAQRKNYERSLLPTESPAKTTSYKAGVAPSSATTLPTRTGPTVQTLLGIQSEANALARASKGADRTLALRVVNGIDETLANVGVNKPGLKALNAAYRDHRLNFPYAFEDAIQSTARPVDAARWIFGEPQRALDLASLSNQSERQQLRQLYGDYVSENGTKVVTKDHAPFLAKLYPNSPLGKPEAWVYADRQAKNLDEIFATSPNARAKLQSQIQAAKQESQAAFEKEVIKQGYQDAKALGPTGSRIKLAMDAARTPTERADVAIRAFNILDPGQAAQDVAAGQQRPGMAAYQSAQQAPQTARMAAQNFQPQDPTAAATKAIQEYSPVHGRWSGYLLRRSAFVGISSGSYGLMTGRVSPMLVGGGVAAGTVLGRDVISGLWRASVQRSPEAALQFYRAMANPGTPQAMKTIASSIVDAAIAQEYAKHGARPPEAKPTPAPKAAPGPMVSHIENEKAKAIVGPRGAISPERISRVEDLNRGIARGETPTVHADLLKGQLTHTDVAKMVQPDKPGLAALFQGMSPQQAVDAFAMANPSERELALPAIAKKLQDDSARLGPQQTAAAIQRLKSIMAEQAA